MIAFLLAARAFFGGVLGFLAKVPPWAWKAIGVAVLAGLLLLGGAHWQKGKDAAALAAKDAEIERLKSDLKTSQANATTLEAAITKQNASIEATAAEGKKRVETSQAATEKAKPVIDRLTTEKAKADAYQRPAAMDDCTAARAMVEADNGR
jgi:preprotein translocase subunit SecD